MKVVFTIVNSSTAVVHTRCIFIFQNLKVCFMPSTPAKSFQRNALQHNNSSHRHRV